MLFNLLNPQNKTIRQVPLSRYKHPLLSWVFVWGLVIVVLTEPVFDSSVSCSVRVLKNPPGLMWVYLKRSSVRLHNIICPLRLPSTTGPPAIARSVWVTSLLNGKENKAARTLSTILSLSLSLLLCSGRCPGLTVSRGGRRRRWRPAFAIALGWQAWTAGVKETSVLSASSKPASLGSPELPLLSKSPRCCFSFDDAFMMMYLLRCVS